MIGGGGEKKTLRLVAEYGDACNLFVRLGKEEVARKLEILKQHCQEIGRDYDEIEKTALAWVIDELHPQEILEECKQMRELGFTHLIFSFRNSHTLTPLTIFGEKIIPAAAAL